MNSCRILQEEELTDYPLLSFHFLDSFTGLS